MSLGLEAKFVMKYLGGEFSSYEEFFEELFKEERHFAKRQQTWYNKEKNLIWLDAKDNLLEKDLINGKDVSNYKISFELLSAIAKEEGYTDSVIEEVNEILNVLNSK